MPQTLARRASDLNPELARASSDSMTMTRELFWNNVIREILTSLSVASYAAQNNIPAPSADKNGQGTSLFDGRLAVITNQGQRIPISSVGPLFACGIDTSPQSKALSMAVECTVFQIGTPSGEVYTLPLHEIRGFHSFSEEAMKEFTDQAAMRMGDQEGASEPFGFAAFTSLARAKQEDEPTPQAGWAGE